MNTLKLLLILFSANQYYFRLIKGPIRQLIRHRALRHCWSELMLKSCFWRNVIILFKGTSPRRVASRRVQSQTLFRLFFLISKNQAYELQNGSLGGPKIAKKTRKMRSWNLENHGFALKGRKKDYFHLAAKNSRNGVENRLKIA